MNSPSLVKTIIGAHCRRVGWIRGVLGAALLYSVAPITVLVHMVLYPFHSLLSVFSSKHDHELRHYIVIDRHKIKELHWVDKLGCMYCALVNGSTLYSQVILEERLAKKDNNVYTRILYNSVIFAYFLPITFKNWLARKLIIEPFLRLYKVYAPPKASTTSSFLLNQLNLFRDVLAQTERTACPIKHLEDHRHVLPEHHRDFFSRDDIQAVIDAI